VRRGGEPRGPLSLRDRVLRAVRVRGLLDPNGVAVLRRDLLADAVYGAQVGVGAGAALEPVVADLVADGRLSAELAEVRGGALVWPGTDLDGAKAEVVVWRPVAVPVQRLPRQRDVEPTPEQEPQEWLRGFLSTYEVEPFLRRLPHGRRASAEARELYRQLRARGGLPGELPPGFTVVSGHERSRWRRW
jgi:hypothetical protein